MFGLRHQRQPMSPKAKTAVGLAAALAIAVPVIAQWEGKENDPYQDIVGVWTVCYGETRGIERRSYTDAECTAMLNDAAGEFGERVLARNPNLADHPNALAAATSLSYNIGSNAYAGSTAARRFERGDIRGGCEAMRWFNRAGGRVVRGLVNRREAEYQICIRDAE